MTSLSNAYHINTASKLRKENDYYPTAPIATLTLLHNCEVPERILEPAAGRGWISKVLEDTGREVVSRDLFDYPSPLVRIETGVDFLSSPQAEVDGVVTNPPYKSGMAEKFCRHSIKNYRFTAMFCRLTFMEGMKRHKFFSEHPPTKIIIMSARVNCDESYFDPPSRQLGGMVAYAWFVWDKRVTKTNEIVWADAREYLHELT